MISRSPEPKHRLRADPLSPHMDHVLRSIRESERIGHEILSIKSQIVSLDAKRQKDREAVRALSKERDGGDAKSWILTGNLFVKTRTETAKLLIARDAQDLDTSINELRDRLKERVEALNKLEGRRSVAGPEKALTRAERTALSDILPVTTDLHFYS